MIGGLEFLAGTVIGITGPQRIYHFALHITAPEIYNGDHHGHAARLIREGAALLAQSPGHFVVFYLLVHGALKMTITATLLRGRGRWVFPFATVILSGFIAYMGYELTDEWSDWLLGLMLFDTVTLALVLNEWHNWEEA